MDENGIRKLEAARNKLSELYYLPPVGRPAWLEDDDLVADLAVALGHVDRLLRAAVDVEEMRER